MTKRSCCNETMQLNLIKYLIKNYGSYSILYFKYIFCLTEALFCFVKNPRLKVTVCRELSQPGTCLGEPSCTHTHTQFIFKRLNTPSTHSSFCRSGSQLSPRDPHCTHEAVTRAMFSGCWPLLHCAARGRLPHRVQG